MSFLNSKIIRLSAMGLFMFAILLLECCKPDIDPDDGADSPVFKIVATVDGLPLVLKGGENDAYMFTEFSHNAQDSLYTFTGRLEKAGCTNCGESVEISINDAVKTQPGQPADITNALNKQNYTYKDLTAYSSRAYTLTFVAQDSGFISPTYAWNFGGGKGTDTTQKITNVTFSDSTNRTVCLTVSDSKGTKTICNTIKPFETNQGDSNVPGFNYYVLKTVNFVNTSYGHSFFWDFGDGNTSNAYSPEHLYAKTGTYRVCLTSVVGGVSRTLCKNVVFKDAAFTSIANYSYHTPGLKIVPVSSASKIKVKYRDANGEEYESDKQSQPPTSVFKILSHSGFDLNEKGQKTRLVRANVKCILFSTTTAKTKELIIPEAVIAVAYP